MNPQGTYNPNNSWGYQSPSAMQPAAQVAPLSAKVYGAPSGYDIAPGASLPPKSEVSSLSTTQGQQIIKPAIDQHNQDIARLTTNTATAPKDQPAPKPASGALTYDEAKSLGVDLNSATYDEGTNTYIPSLGDQENNNQQKQIKDDLKAGEQEITSAFEVASKNADAATQNLINSIQGIYSARIQARQIQNKREEDTLSAFGVRQGTGRYAGEVQAGLLSAQERSGLQRIEEIAAEEASAITSATNALSEKKYSLFLRAREEVTNLRNEKQSVLQKLQEEALKTQREARQSEIQASRDGAVAGILKQGITDPAQVLNLLNYDEKGKQVGDFSAKEVQAAIKSLAPEDNLKSLTGETKNFYALKEKGILPDSITSLPEGDQLFAYLRQQKQAVTITKVKSTGGGTSNTIRKPSQTDIQQGHAILDDTTKDANGYSVRGEDGYVDPYVYKNMYNEWINPSDGSPGYSPAEFLKNYPPKNYVNPQDNEILPSYLQTPAKAKKATTSGGKS